MISRLLPLLMVPAALCASVSFDVSVGVLKDSNGHPAPLETLVLLVASADGEFHGPDGKGNFTRPQEHVLFRADGSSLHMFGDTGLFSFFAAQLQPGNGWESGQRLALYWYPDLSVDADRPPPGEPYGIIAPSPSDTPDGGDPWGVPGDGGSVSLRFFTTDTDPAFSSGTRPPDSGLPAYARAIAPDGEGTVRTPHLPGELIFVWQRQLPADWVLTQSLGWVNKTYGAWLYTPFLGYFRAFGESEDGYWLYHPDEGWLWTGMDYVPYFYHWDDRRWRYMRDTGGTIQWYEYFPDSGWIRHVF